MTTAPIVLVPGFWLGAWAWDEVAAGLRADGHHVTAVTLPGLESAEADRSKITFADHVDAICDAVTAAGRPVVLAVHSGAGAPGYAVTDRIPERLAAMVYVDTGPAIGALDPDFKGLEKALPSREELAKNENLDGLTEQQLETFRRRPFPSQALHCARRPSWPTTRGSMCRARSSAPGTRPRSTRTPSRRARRGWAVWPSCAT
jgi:pimeloyl-ACP methyl ester carboxylesterase